MPGDTKFDTSSPLQQRPNDKEIFMLKFLIIWSAAIRDYDFYVQPLEAEISLARQVSLHITWQHCLG